MYAPDRVSSVPLPESTVRELSVAASCDPRTLKKVLRGQPVLPMARARVVRVLEERGLRHLLPDEAPGGVR
jgi:hypothetical protein